MIRFFLTATLIAASALTLSCNVNQYCLNCEQGGGDGGLDATVDSSDGGSDAMVDAGSCVPSGTEICDGKDNDCDGQIDNGPLPGVGDPCDNQMGECAGAIKACINGQLICRKNGVTVPSAEVCDNKDNNCNGMVDEGDPGGGAKCGTDVGECVAGTNHCVNGTVQCQGAVGTVGGQPELCNGKDDDCDGNFDEGLTNLGSCGQSNVGACHFGQLGCVGGGVTCVGNQDPTFEICDGIDNDCDGVIDNGFNKMTDPQNCMTCGHVCSFAHANAACVGGVCGIGSCQAGYHNNNNMTADGCEFGPCFSTGTEVCNGLDDDCNGAVDDGLTPPAGLCKTAGACAGSFAMCMGAQGWKCVYPSGQVSVDVNGNIIPETSCDGIDNDCDGIVDNNQPNKGQACHDAGLGVCQGTGTFICDAANINGPTKCNITTPGQTPSPEKCDNLDNDCDGVVDNGAATGNLVGQDWVTIPGTATQIMKWEASKPDATAAAGGSATTYACSKQGVQPWTNVTYPQAVTACTSVGGRLCTEAEWQNMCSQPVAPIYPLNGPVGATDYVFIEAENASLRVANTGGTPSASRSWVNGAPGVQNFSGVTDVTSNINTDTAIISAANAPTQSARMDFPIKFSSAGTYFIWVRMFGTANNDSVYVGINATVPGTANGTALILNAAQYSKYTWIESAGIAVAAAGTQTVSIYMRRDGVRVDAIAITEDGTDVPPFSNESWSYATNPKLPQPQVCNDQPFDTNTGLAGNQDDVLPTGSMASCFAQGGGVNQAYDMSGNVKEWAAARAANQNPIRGGSSSDTVDGTSCQLNFTLADNAFFFPDTGFRCCR